MDKWQIDKLIEENVARFTDKHFWSKFKVPAERVEDKQLQYAGVDVKLGSTSFDEKAKIRGCLNSVCQYPSFELKMTSRGGSRLDGWFFSALSTDYYAFIAVSADTSIENELSADGRISAVDMLWVKKQDVKDMLYEQMTDEQLEEDIQELQDEDCLDALLGWNWGKARKKYEHGKFWLTYSKYLKEQPVNLVAARETLEQLPHTKHFIVTEKGVKKL